ncbi:MAG: hypothetical protein KI793_10970 [Rivularia sp. (in: Bacteria)]|nr:hypothetical protein [Rivularia sp. MS3]
MLNRMRAVTFAALMLATGSPAIVNNPAVAQVQRPTKIASTVLVTVNGYQLTQSMVDSAIQVGEFLADHKFTAAEKGWIQEFLVESFRQNPVGIVQEDKFVRQVLSDIKKYSQRRVSLAQIRESLFANIYLSRLANNTVNQPSIMTIVYKYSPVIFADPKYKIIATKRTIDSLVASHNFVATLARKPLKKVDYNWWAQYLQQHYYTKFSPNQRRYLAIAESRWVRLQTAWSHTPPQKRQNVVGLIHRKFKSGYNTAGVARQLENIVSGENRTANGSNTAGQFNQAEYNHGMGMINTFRRMMAY